MTSTFEKYTLTLFLSLLFYSLSVAQSVIEERTKLNTQNGTSNQTNSKTEKEETLEWIASKINASGYVRFDNCGCYQCGDRTSIENIRYVSIATTMQATSAQITIEKKTGTVDEGVTVFSKTKYQERTSTSTLFLNTLQKVDIINYSSNSELYKSYEYPCSDMYSGLKLWFSGSGYYIVNLDWEKEYDLKNRMKRAFEDLIKNNKAAIKEKY